MTSIPSSIPAYTDRYGQSGIREEQDQSSRRSTIKINYLFKGIRETQDTCPNERYDDISEGFDFAVRSIV